MNANAAIIFLAMLAAACAAMLALPRLEHWLRHRKMDVYTPTPRGEREPCQACLATCSECDGEGIVICRRCGSSGEIVLEEILCPECKDQPFDLECRVCHGTRKIAAQKMQCPVCKGAKKQRCPLCRGTGEESTGRVNTNRPEHILTAEQRGWYDQAPMCPRCGGNTFVNKHKGTTKEICHG